MVYVKLFPLLLTPPPIQDREEEGGLKLWRPLSTVSLFPGKGSRVRQVTPGLLDVALEIISFASPPLSLPYLIPSHWYQLAVPHIRGRTWPSQLLLLCTKTYPGEQHSQRGFTYEREITEEPRETGSGTHF